MTVKDLSVNSLVAKNATTGVLLAVLIGMMSLTTLVGCSSQKQIKNLKSSVKMCRKENKKALKKVRRNHKECKKSLKICRKMRDKNFKKMERYENKLCN